MKTLLKIDLLDDTGSVSVGVNVKSVEDIFALCSALYSVITTNCKVGAGFEAILEIAKTNPQFDKMLNESTVKMPDFDSILKS